jgi:hypothetical protein
VEYMGHSKDLDVGRVVCRVEIVHGNVDNENTIEIHEEVTERPFFEVRLEED